MLVEKINSCVVLYDVETSDVLGYFDEKRIMTRRGLIRLIRELCNDSWVTTRHIKEVIDLAHSLFGKN